ARAALRQAIGAPVEAALPIAVGAPAAEVPAEDVAALRQAARSHPRVARLASMAAAEEQAARAARARAFPDLMVGVEYVRMSEARVHGGGGVPLMVMVAVDVPLWRGLYRSAERRAVAGAASLRARQREAELAAEAELDAALAAVRDAARRVHVHEHTLIPQAETAYEAVMGGYQGGGASLADGLLAQRDVLDLRLQLVAARVDLARAWARVVEIAGRPVAARPYAPAASAAPTEVTP